MRRGMELLVGMALASGFLTIAPQPSRAAGIEKSLLGVRILQSYREVLRLYGAPSRIYRGNEPILVVEAKNADGDMTGGIASLGESSGGGMPSGGPGGDGPSTGGGGMSVPGRGGAPGSGAGGGGGEASTTFAQSGGFRWAYYYPKTSKLYIFIFNSEGRLIATLERGRSGGGGTSQGVNLGSSLASVYSQYGWPDNVEEQGNGIVLNYSQKHHLLVAVISGKVVGVAVSLFEEQSVRMLGIGEPSGGGGAPSGGGGPSSGGGMRAPGGKSGGGMRMPPGK